MGAGLIVEAFISGEAVGGALRLYRHTLKQQETPFLSSLQRFSHLLTQYPELGRRLLQWPRLCSWYLAAFEAVGGIVMAVAGSISGIIQTTARRDSDGYRRVCWYLHRQLADGRHGA